MRLPLSPIPALCVCVCVNSIIAIESNRQFTCTHSRYNAKCVPTSPINQQENRLIIIVFFVFVFSKQKCPSVHSVSNLTIAASIPVPICNNYANKVAPFITKHSALSIHSCTEVAQ